MLKKEVWFFGLVLILFIFLIDNVNALIVTDASTSYSSGFFNVTVGSNNNYTLYVNITNNGDAIGTGFYNITFYFPYGMKNVTQCNGTGSFRNINLTFEACTTSVAVGAGATFTFNTNITSTISAFSRFLDAREFIIANVTNGTMSNTTTLNSAGIYGINYWINPRPYAVNNSYHNATLKFTSWGQSRAKYEAWVPLYTYNVTINKTQMANRTTAGIMYANEPFYKNPEYFEIASYLLNFTIYNVTGNQAGNIKFQIKTANYDKNCQLFMPLQEVTESFTDPMSNESYNQTIAIPGGGGPTGSFNVWFYNSSTYEKHLPGSLTGNYSINVSYSMAEANANLILNVSLPPRNDNVSLSLRYSLIPSEGPGECSPLYIENQAIVGFDPENDPPDLGQQINNSYQIKINNSLPNFTFNNLIVRFVQPLNISMNLTNSTVVSYNLNRNLFVGWLNTSNIWDNQSMPFSAFTECNAFNDTLMDSPTNGSSVTVCFYIADINLSTSYFNNWNPGQKNSNITVNLTSTMQFPIMGERSGVVGTAGSSNSYNVSVSMSTSSTLTIPTSKLTGLTSTNCPTASTCSINISIDGSEIASVNYTIGSISLNSKLSASTHSISVSYGVPSSGAASTSSSGAGSASSAAGGASLPVNELQELKETITPLLGTGESFKFTLDNKITNHTLTILAIDNVSVKIRISSEPIELTFKVNEEKEVDLNNDTINDINIKLIEIKNGIFAKFSIKKLPQKELPGKEANITEEKEKETKELIKEGVSENKYYYIILAIIIIIILIFLRKKKSSS